MTTLTALTDINGPTRPEVRRNHYGQYLVVPPNGGKPVGYKRATTVAGWTDDKQSLIDWKATAAIVGTHRSPSLAAQWQNLIARHDGDPWYSSAEAKKACKALVEESAKVGGSQDRADIGTLMHTLFELASHGRDLPPVSDAIRADVDAYLAVVTSLGIQVDPAYIEQMVVLDKFRIAGTADMGRVTVPGLGDVIADWKTGADLGFSWRSITTQMTIYSLADNTYRQGEATDGSQDVRGPVPDISKEHALVFHIPAGQGTCTPYVVRLEPDALELAFRLDGWRKRRDLAVPLADLLGTPSPVPVPTPEPTRGQELSAVPTSPDEGDEVNPLELSTWKESFATLDAAAKTWISGLVNAAQRNLVSFHMGQDAPKSQRRIGILAGLIRIVRAGEDNDDMLRRLIATTVDADWPLFANVEPGHALGALGADEAQVFAGLADALATDDGSMRAALAALAPAA